MSADEMPTSEMIETELRRFKDKMVEAVKSVTFEPIEEVEGGPNEVLDYTLRVSDALAKMRESVALMVTRFPEGRSRSMAWAKAQEMFFWLENSVAPSDAESFGLPQR